MSVPTRDFIGPRMAIFIVFVSTGWLGVVISGGVISGVVSEGFIGVVEGVEVVSTGVIGVVRGVEGG
ncbi:MAG: hypothetical protein QXN49_06100 [Archaeoglobaceae archaeon]